MLLGVKPGEPLDARQVLQVLWDADLEIENLVEASALIDFIGPSGPDVFDATLLRANLFPYQVAGSKLLAKLTELGVGALLADEMGLGKTMQALYALSNATKRHSFPNLIVAPSSTIANWEREIGRFAPMLAVTPHFGPHRTGDPSKLSVANLVLTSYDLLTRDASLFESVSWGLIVLDEAQAIKNPAAQRSRVVKLLSRSAGVAITGTPIENSLTDMWSIFEFVSPETLGSFDSFQNEYPDQVDAAYALSKRIAPLVLRRTVAEVATDLPPRVDVATPIYVSSRLAQLYDQARSQPGQPSIVTLMRLRQLCSSPSLLDSSWNAFDDFPKFDRLIEILDEIVETGSKALIFAPFAETIDQVLGCIVERYSGIFAERIDGRLPPRLRQDLIDSFSTFTGAAVLVMNPKAAGVGLNIQAASHVIHFSPEWNPAIVAQASARAHRRGQLRPVFVHYLYYVGTVEELMMNRLDAKRSLQDASMAGVSGEPSESDLVAALRLSPTR
jgi:SNF2 family DNA or RNA helicase